MSESPSLTPKHFEHNTREPALVALWEKHEVGKPEKASSSAPVFNIAMPPPNANGELHLGHAFGYTVMDILGRFHRLMGEQVLLLPGKDHAGIQTQVVFEKKLRTEGVDVRTSDISELYQQCYDFCIDRSQYMRSQEKRLGLSADWSREIFTLDPRVSEIVFETFEKMWNDGLVYKGHRIVNWSVFSQTSISDVEVEYREQDGHLWYFLYPFADGGSYPTAGKLKLPSGEEVFIGDRGLVVATTRPETMLGDTGLAVNPDDERYACFIGKQVKVPLHGRVIPIIADKRIDKEFGTGVVKVTPAHDFTDYDIGADHNLQMVQIIGKDGKMTSEAGSRFTGLSTAECRELVLQGLETERLLLDTTKIRHKVPIGERGKDIIEPLISEQWFVNVDKEGKSLKENALSLLRAGKIRVFPPRFQSLFEQWLENLRDWNISRQLWWGHRLPVWYRERNGSVETVVGQKAPPGEGWIQEKDTFDTWFSSGQWAFSTAAACGLLDLAKPHSDYFPTHTMVMGRDILFFWACRMLLLTSYRTGDVPWRNIFFTGLIRDEHGQKMSKSKGNGIEPNEMIDKYGADALRLALVMGATPGNDMALSERKFDGYSKFINKLWNAAKLYELKVGALPPSAPPNSIQLVTSRWILQELKKVFESVTDQFQRFDISIAADELYSFTWQTFCDWYLEIMKILIDKGSESDKAEVAFVTTEVLKSILTMLHPILPFITEEIAQSVPTLRDGELLATSRWKIPHVPRGEEVSLNQLSDIVTAVRSVKAALNIPHKSIRVSITEQLSPEFELLVRELGKVELVEASSISPDLALRKPYSTGVVTLEVEGKENYRKRLEKDLEGNRKLVTSLEKKLSGDFAKMAKPDLVEKERDRLTNAQRAITELQRELAGI